MQNNHYGYGTSAYHPTQHVQREPTPPPKIPKTRRRLTRALQILVLIFIGLFLIGLYLLADFRFLFCKYPAFAGFPFGNRTYLVLFQNNYELRPTGGFISTYGELKFSHGVYKGIDFFDVYGEIDDHKRIDPPLVLGVLLEDENYIGHTFRDANFDPDFTLAKDDLIEMYSLSHPEDRVDGIIAADFSFLEDLVALHEPLTVEDYELTEDNLFETLSTIVSDVDRHSEEALAARKNITGPIVKKIIKKSLIFPWNVRPLMNAAANAFEERHLLASFEKRNLEKPFLKRHWTGSLPESNAGDFLAVNEGNYGGMKSDRYITRDVTYELDITDERDILGNPVVKATVTVQLSHEGIYNTPLSGPFTGYLRVMAPLGADVETGGDIQEEREDVTVMATLMDLLPGERKSISYSYTLPEYVWVDGTYFLHLHKQPGTENDHYRVIVRAPQGMGLSSDTLDVRENVGFFEAPLLTDMNLSFALTDDESAPRIVSHELTALNEITVVFNEPLSPEYAGNPGAFAITDLNVANPDTDTLEVANVRVDASTIILTLNGMTAQDEEFYELVLRDIKDLNDNFISPNPRTVTVVQRNLGTPTEIEEDVTEEEPLEETESTETNE